LRRSIKELVGHGEVYVLGLGNTDRADDGAGILAAQALKRLFPSSVFSEHDGVEGVVLDISEKIGDISVFFIDAANMHAKPGSIRLIAREEIADSEVTTHRVMVGLMASILDRAGKRCAVIGIQPGSIKFGGSVSKGVQRAITVVVTALERIMRESDGRGCAKEREKEPKGTSPRAKVADIHGGKVRHGRY